MDASSRHVSPGFSSSVYIKPFIIYVNLALVSIWSAFHVTLFLVWSCYLIKGIFKNVIQNLANMIRFFNKITLVQVYLTLVVWRKSNVFVFLRVFELKMVLTPLVVCFQNDGWRGGVCSATWMSSIWTIMGGVCRPIGIYCQNPSNSRKVWNMQDSPTTRNYLIPFSFLWTFL